MIELNEETADIFSKYDQITPEYIADFHKIVLRLANILFSTQEFKDVADILEDFAVKLNNLSLKEIDKARANLIYILLTQIGEDIQKWLETIFIKRG